MVEVIGANKILSRNVENEKTRLWKISLGNTNLLEKARKKKLGKETERVKKKKKKKCFGHEFQRD